MADGNLPTNADMARIRIAEKLRRELGGVVLRLLEEPDVIEIMLNDDGVLWCERLGAGMACVGEMPAHQALSAISTVASTLNTTVTAERPILECELPLDGSRFEALIPPIVHAPVFTIRRKAAKVFKLQDYVTSGMMSAGQAECLRQAVGNHRNILVVGGTGSGKTTLTNAILDAIADVSPDDRLVIIEDTAELQCRAANRTVLRSNANVSMLQLLKATMRLRPDRIVVGEVRGGEALALLKAWNTGHPGGAATVHANDARAGLIRIEGLVAEANTAPMHALIAEAINVVVCIGKTPEGRRVKEILAVNGYDGKDYVTKPIIN